MSPQGQWKPLEQQRKTNTSVRNNIDLRYKYGALTCVGTMDLRRAPLSLSEGLPFSYKDYQALLGMDSLRLDLGLRRRVIRNIAFES